MTKNFGLTGKEMQGAMNLIGSVTGQHDNGNDLVYGYRGHHVDTLYGSHGNDSYYVDHPDDTIYSNKDGIDTVYSRVSYKLPANVDNIVLLGDEDLVARGNYNNNTLLGNNGDDTLIGGSGSNRFFVQEPHKEVYYGSDGSNTMYGGPRSNYYLVNDPGDKVIANPNHTGIDSVYSLIDYKMPEGIERLYLITRGDRYVLGNNIDNDIYGNCGDNFITGGNGNDNVYGGGYGNDTLIGNAGDDRLYSSLESSQLFGGEGNDMLLALEGNDLYSGGQGNDYYTGFYRNEVDSHYNIGFGHDIIDKWYGSDKAGYDPEYKDTVNLSQFDVKSVAFSTLDVSNNGIPDALMIDCGQYGSIQINNYFDDINYVSSSKPGIANMTDILFSNNVDLHFNDVQNLLV